MRGYLIFKKACSKQLRHAFFSLFCDVIKNELARYKSQALLLARSFLGA